jgi:HEAT repeats
MARKEATVGANLNAMTTRALAAALRSAAAGPEVLGEVIRREPDNLRGVLERVVASPARASELRRIASTTLGKIQDSRSIPALLAAARSRDDELARRAIEALGKVGTAETLARLGRLRKSRPQVRRSLAFARSLIAHRHGLSGWALRLPRSAKVMQIDTDRAVVLGCKRLSRKEWSALAPSLRVIEEVVPPADKAPLAFQCGKEEFLLLVNPLLQLGVSAMTRPLVAAALVKLSRAQQQWFVAEYFFCDLARGGRARIVGARPTGTVVHVGFAVAEHGDVHVELQSLDTPLAMPTFVTAAVGPTVQRGLRFEALVERTRPRSVNKPRVPAQVLAGSAFSKARVGR